MRLPLLTAALCLLQTPALAANPAEARPQPLPSGCDAFTWDVRHAIDILQAPADTLQTATTAKAAGKPITLGVRHDLALHPQRQVALAVPPGKPVQKDDATAGMVVFRVPADGRYRIALTRSHWLDVVDAGTVIPSLDFQGRPGCPLVHKFVEFQLPAGRDLILQLSGGDGTTAGLLIEAAPR